MDTKIRTKEKAQRKCPSLCRTCIPRMLAVPIPTWGHIHARLTYITMTHDSPPVVHICTFIAHITNRIACGTELTFRYFARPLSLSLSMSLSHSVPGIPFGVYFCVCEMPRHGSRATKTSNISREYTSIPVLNYVCMCVCTDHLEGLYASFFVGRFQLDELVFGFGCTSQ